MKHWMFGRRKYVRISAESMTRILDLCEPEIDGSGRCMDCAAEAEQCSPPYWNHYPGCRTAGRSREAYALIKEALKR